MVDIRVIDNWEGRRERGGAAEELIARNLFKASLREGCRSLSSSCVQNKPKRARDTGSTAPLSVLDGTVAAEVPLGALAVSGPAGVK